MSDYKDVLSAVHRSDTCTIELDATPTQKLIETANYSKVARCVLENMDPPDAFNGKREIILFCRSQQEVPAEIENMLSQCGFRSATLYELLVVGAQHQDLHHPIVSPGHEILIKRSGSRSFRVVPVIHFKNDTHYVDATLNDTLFDSYARYAMVRMSG